MIADFSESSFAFAFTHELITKWSGLFVGSPNFPSTSVEGLAAGGFDVGLTTSYGYIYLVQFKLAEYLRTGQAIEARDWGRAVPYYRFALRRPPSHQHEYLLAHETAGAVVEYVAPRFHTQASLENAFGSGSVIASSQRVPPSTIGEVPDDGDEHRVAYSPDGSDLKRYSEPMAIPANPYGDITEEGFSGNTRDAAVRPAAPLSEQITTHVDMLRARTAGQLGDAAYPNGDPVGALRVLSRTVLGAEAFVIRVGTIDEAADGSTT